MIMVRDPNDPAPDTVEYRHGLTPPMRDARKRRFRREPDLNVSLPSLLCIFNLLMPYILRKERRNPVSLGVKKQNIINWRER
jgi:hypothetical protein